MTNKAPSDPAPLPPLAEGQAIGSGTEETPLRGWADVFPGAVRPLVPQPITEQLASERTRLIAERDEARRQLAEWMEWAAVETDASEGDTNELLRSVISSTINSEFDRAQLAESQLTALRALSVTLRDEGDSVFTGVDEGRVLRRCGERIDAALPPPTGTGEAP